MAKAPDGGTEGGATLWGMSAKTWIAIWDKLGIPTLFMLFFCYMAYQWVPPIATAHIDLLRRTGDTLASMDETLTQSNKMLEQLANRSYPSEDFREEVHEEHIQHSRELEKLGSQIDELGVKIERLSGAD